VQAKTGLLLDPYFGASRSPGRWRTWPQVREAGDDLCVGTVESGWCSG
jgi:glycerol kinase